MKYLEHQADKKVVLKLLERNISDKEMIELFKTQVGKSRRTWYRLKYILKHGKAPPYDRKGYFHQIKRRMGCYFCYSRKNLLFHHISYTPEKTIKLCSRCHNKIHILQRYNEMFCL